MTRDNWVTIAATSATLIVNVAIAIISARSKSRSVQPRPTPAASQPANRIQRIGGWFIRHASWLLLLLIAINLITLTSDLRSSAPLSRWGVFHIAAALTSITINIAGLIFIAHFKAQSKLFQALLNVVRDNDRDTLDLIKHVYEATTTADRAIINVIEGLASTAHVTSEALNKLSDAQKQPTQDTFDRIRAALKRLLE